ncbi:Glyoxylase, beta-lactamase superfamily II [Allopseudospirillum japonicum]|uniref:Glyoxylase, beta-lactamase superfamily II n=1 Tax=Allopseudospirillum japonicum TaxID=64971 RepID=A0A1H6TEG2_9GAMM|nr:MBL fold metallo-hydrolase [Allopseudospirillum japonicum]SEI74172.1 Glyoxylase, beta-lactamase superfamily II [Allopseudospirillum japonicum]
MSTSDTSTSMTCFAPVQFADFEVQAFFHQDTSTLTYVVFAQGEAVVIDPVLDFDAPSGRTSNESVQRLVDFLHAHQLRLVWILETHAHADHLSGAQALKALAGGQVVIGEAITQVQKVFKSLFHLDDVSTQGQEFDYLAKPNHTLTFAQHAIEVLHTPGHTPACVSYKIGPAVFVGDTLFMPDVGTARCDFPGGDAATLYASIQRLLALPEHTCLFMCHDYPPEGREVAFQSSVAEQKAANIHVGQGRTQEDFVRMRSQRDAGLAVPRLLLPSIQINIRAGHLPEAEANQVAYLKLPLNQL